MELNEIGKYNGATLVKALSNWLSTTDRDVTVINNSEYDIPNIEISLPKNDLVSVRIDGVDEYNYSTSKKCQYLELLKNIEIDGFGTIKENDNYLENLLEVADIHGIKYQMLCDTNNLNKYLSNIEMDLSNTTVNHGIITSNRNDIHGNDICIAIFPSDTYDRDRMFELVDTVGIPVLGFIIKEND